MTICPVPSGEPSSTTSTSSRPSCLRTESTIRRMFSRSLYVGTMTSARSRAGSGDTPTPLGERARQRGQHREQDREGGHELPLLVGGIVEVEEHLRRARGKWSAKE